jgi:hypothetical protein
MCFGQEESPRLTLRFQVVRNPKYLVEELLIHGLKDPWVAANQYEWTTGRCSLRVANAAEAAGPNAGFAGSSVGLVVAFATTRLLATWLYGVGPLDVVTFMAGTLTLLTTVALASYMPARRAAQIEPMVALRSE